MAEQTVLEKTKISAASDVQTVSERTEKVPEYILNPKKEKNYGVELLRIVSMLFIVVLHVINFGGISYHHSGMYFGLTAENMAHYKVMNIILAFCYCAVNCYALISGYVGCKSKFRISKLISLWVTVVSINAIIYGITYAFSPEIAASYDIMRIFTPLTNDQYWYFTAYMGLLVIMPALNAAVNNIPKKQFGYMLIGCFLFFVLFPSSINKDLFYTHTGYSMLWLVLLYMTGAYFKLHFRPQKKALLRTVCVLVYAASCLGLAFVRFGKEEVLLSQGGGYVLYANDYIYTSVYVVAASIALFVLFITINIRNKIAAKIIGFVSGTTFGIYLIHLNYIVFDHVITYRFAEVALLENPYKMAVGIFVSALLVFALCSACEKVRLLLFKYLYIDKLISLTDKISLPIRKNK